MERIQRRLIVPDELAGRRLDQAAAVLLPEFSRSRLNAWIDAGVLTVDGGSVRPRTLLEGGEEVVLDTQLPAAVGSLPEDIPVALVYGDADLLVLDKPAGLVVHPGAGNASGTLLNALLHRFPEVAVLPRAGLVHRIDKDTSGLLVVARTLASQKTLAAALERHAVRRTYQAICNAALTGGGAIEAPIGRHPRERTKMAVIDGGREARTRYRVLERFRAQTLVEVDLETGRTHQIRVHMAHIRAPLVGDPVYGGRPRLPRQATPELRAALQGFRRQALHASRIAFTHPVTGAELVLESALPKDLQALLAALRADVEAAR
jgi:23S rRNA pseudouridine1911/1915/1917 synthase